MGRRRRVRTRAVERQVGGGSVRQRAGGHVRQAEGHRVTPPFPAQPHERVDDRRPVADLAPDGATVQFVRQGRQRHQAARTAAGELGQAPVHRSTVGLRGAAEFARGPRWR